MRFLRRSRTMSTSDSGPPTLLRKNAELAVVLARCKEASPFPLEMRAAGIPFIIYNKKTDTCNNTKYYERLLRDHLPQQPPVRWLDHNNGDECSSYVQFIVDHYDRLPRVVAFLQYDSASQLLNYQSRGHRKFNGSLIQALDMVQASSMNAKRGFLALSRHSLEGPWPGPCEPPIRAHRFKQCSMPILKRLMGPTTPSPDFIRFYANGLFAVSRVRIRRRPLSFYQRFLSELSGSAEAACDGPDTRSFVPTPTTNCTSSIPTTCTSGRHKRLVTVGECHVLEKLWHVMFFEPLVCPPPLEYNAWRAPGVELAPMSRIAPLPEIPNFVRRIILPEKGMYPARCGSI